MSVPGIRNGRHGVTVFFFLSLGLVLVGVGIERDWPFDALPIQCLKVRNHWVKPFVDRGSLNMPMILSCIS